MRRIPTLSAALLAAAMILAGTGCSYLKSRDHLNQGIASYRNARYGDAVELFEQSIKLDPNWRLLLVVGLLGGYTTFSSVEWETYSSVREGGLWTGMLNVVSSVMLGYVAVLGSMLARR